MISHMSTKHVQATLDQFISKPLTSKMERFIKLCEFYKANTGKEPDCPHSVYNFVQDNKLPGDVKQFKFFTLRSIAAYYGKWENISGDGKHER